MSDIVLINLIIQRLEERRYSAQTEIRLLTQRIQRLQNARHIIAEQVRQRSSRRHTYNTYQDRNHEEEENQQAPDFPNQDNQVNQEDQEENLAQAERDFIEERGYEEARQAGNRVQPQARRTRRARNRPQRSRLSSNRPRNLEEERRIRLERITGTANDLADDIVRGIHINLRNIREQVRRAHQPQTNQARPE
mmetsp:Transcript_2129/g.3266  ORF Transcript_2129/g.3266 Transcript_2129/m.3266 type:complete len:193 (+) Transcript_2129:82-660(+)